MVVADELTQEEIDRLFSGSEETSSSGDQQINEKVKEFADILNSSIEDVFKTAFSLEVVSKFIDLSIKNREELEADSGVFVYVKISREKKTHQAVVRIDKKFASILADLMLMGPGEAKENLEPDDLDALKELFSQVMGNAQTAIKEKLSIEANIAVENVSEELSIEGESFYRMDFDVAITNVEDGLLRLCSEKNGMDSIFQTEEEQEEEETESGEEKEEIPFEEVERKPTHAEPAIEKEEKKPDNLDLILDVDLDVKVRIGKKSMLIKDVLKLKDGSIIELDKNIEEPMEILINDKVVAKGVVVVVGGRFGVKITSIETKEERIKSLGG